MTDDPYQILGIEPGASDRELRRAFRKRALELHPDRNPGDPKAEARFKRLNAAYRAVRDRPVQTSEPKPAPSTRAGGAPAVDTYSAAADYAYMRAHPIDMPRRKRQVLFAAAIVLFIVWLFGVVFDVKVEPTYDPIFEKIRDSMGERH